MNGINAWAAVLEYRSVATFIQTNVGDKSTAKIIFDMADLIEKLYQEKAAVWEEGFRAGWKTQIPMPKNPYLEEEKNGEDRT